MFDRWCRRPLDTMGCSTGRGGEGTGSLAESGGGGEHPNEGSVGTVSCGLLAFGASSDAIISDAATKWRGLVGLGLFVDVAGSTGRGLVSPGRHQCSIPHLMRPWEPCPWRTRRLLAHLSLETVGADTQPHMSINCQRWSWVSSQRYLPRCSRQIQRTKHFASSNGAIKFFG